MDLEGLVDRALTDPDGGGRHWNVALGDSRVVKVPVTEIVSQSVVEENLELVEGIGIDYVDTMIVEDFQPDFTQVQEIGIPSKSYAESNEIDYIDQVTDILDHVAENTDYVIDAKSENFVVVDDQVHFCDLGDGASICQKENDWMYDQFISTYKRQADRELVDVEILVDEHSNYFESDLKDLYLD